MAYFKDGVRVGKIEFLRMHWLGLSLLPCNDGLSPGIGGTVSSALLAASAVTVEDVPGSGDMASDLCLPQPCLLPIGSGGLLSPKHAPVSYSLLSITDGPVGAVHGCGGGVGCDLCSPLFSLLLLDRVEGKGDVHVRL